VFTVWVVSTLWDFVLRLSLWAWREYVNANRIVMRVEMYLCSKHNVTNVMLFHTANVIQFQTMSDVPLSTKWHALLVSLTPCTVSDSLHSFYSCVN